MSLFDAQMQRLKERLGVATDELAAQALGISAFGLALRRQRGVFPAPELSSKAARLGVDPRYILWGTASRAEEPAYCHALTLEEMAVWEEERRLSEMHPPQAAPQRRAVALLAGALQGAAKAGIDLRRDEAVSLVHYFYELAKA